MYWMEGDRSPCLCDCILIPMPIMGIGQACSPMYNLAGYTNIAYMIYHMPAHDAGIVWCKLCTQYWLVQFHRETPATSQAP